MDLYNYKIKLPKNRHIVLLLDSNDKLWGGTKVNTSNVTIENSALEISIGHFSAQYFVLLTAASDEPHQFLSKKMERAGSH